MKLNKFFFENYEAALNAKQFNSKYKPNLFALQNLLMYEAESIDADFKTICTKWSKGIRTLYIWVNLTF